MNLNYELLTVYIELRHATMNIHKLIANVESYFLLTISVYFKNH